MNENNTSQIWYTAAKRIAAVSAAFALILSVLLVINYIQTKRIDPLNSKALNQLMVELQKNQNDEALKEQIRALDLLARKAYFTNLWQVRTGSLLLFAFVLTFLIALKYISSFQTRFPDLTAVPDYEQMWENRLFARKYIIFTGLGLFVFAFVLSVLTEDGLSRAGMEKGESADEVSTLPGIEEIKQNWPNFRGPEGIGMAYNITVPTQWDGRTGENILWKTEIPVHGFNSPIIWGKKIFLSGADRNTEVVYCIDADSGEILWQTELNDIPGSPVDRPDNTEDTGFAAPTMATDGLRVFILFGTGDVACLDFDGNRIWAKNIGVPENHYGHSSSLITFRNLLLIQYDQNSGGHLIALKTDTGDLVYDQQRDIEISWASPILVNTGKRDEIILNSSPDVISHDPLTGKELWRIDCMSGEVAPSLAYADGIVFAVNQYAKLAAIKLNGAPEILWESEDDLAEVSSPVATKDFVFVAASYGTISCYDSKTGERYWFEDLPKGFYSSPVVVGDNVYLMDMAGTMYIFKTMKEFSLVNTCELGESAVTIPAFMHNRIYIRGFKHLYCIGD
ncbi:MAG: PQQ-binding-like beta-propeller repeat protein [Candidatus Latescibacteria bacterium]|nr:PQQ-binding-like beta-propeller repeat protein [Candidatus Latescibacterota bacterium]